ncbi:MAG: hypothetical protein ACRENP_04480 [Longimicrobiales bacterium]
MSTENIGLARLADGTELIRMGQPLRHEMAAWRYGDTLIKRRRREWITGSALFGSMAGVYWGGFAFGLVGGAAAPVVLHLPEMAVSVFADNRTIARVPGPDGLDYRMSRKHARKARLRPWRSSVVLDVRHARGHSLLDGEAAVRMTALLMPHINALGANRTQVQHAVAELETARSPAHYLRRAADRLHHHPRWRNYVIADAQPEVRLALEMATHEEQERRALEGELAELQAMWREAEEIAAISDNLLLPRTVIDFIRKQKSDQHV